MGKGPLTIKKQIINIVHNRDLCFLQENLY